VNLTLPLLDPSLNYLELLNACDSISLSITDEESQAIERATQKQAESKVWFSQRAGRITASRLKAACHTDISKPSRSLIKTICYPEAHKFTSTATRFAAFLSIIIVNKNTATNDFTLYE